MANDALYTLTKSEFDEKLHAHNDSVSAANSFLEISTYKIENCYLDFALIHYEFKYITFVNVKFHWVLYHCAFRCCTFINCDDFPEQFLNVDITNCTFINCNLNKISFVKTSIDHTTSFQECTLDDVSFQYSDISIGNFTDCHFSSKYIHNSNISSHVLELNTQKNPHIYSLCPTEGKFIGWKKLIRPATDKDISEGYVTKCVMMGGALTYMPVVECLCKLEIPASAKRLSGLHTYAKCRTNKVKVLDIYEIKTGNKVSEANSIYQPSFIYKVGETIKVDDFDTNRWNPCAPGIHFFVDKQAALDYEY